MRLLGGKIAVGEGVATLVLHVGLVQSLALNGILRDVDWLVSKS